MDGEEEVRERKKERQKERKKERQKEASPQFSDRDVLRRSAAASSCRHGPRGSSSLDYYGRRGDIATQQLR